MFRKIGNPKSNLWNNCVGHQYGREYGPYSSKRAVSLARCEVPKTCNSWVSGRLQDGQENGPFSSSRVVVLSVVLCLWFSGITRRERRTGRFPHHAPWSSPFSFALGLCSGFKTLQPFLLWIPQYDDQNATSSSPRDVMPSVLLCLELNQNPTEFNPQDSSPRRGKRTVFLKTVRGPFRFALPWAIRLRLTNTLGFTDRCAQHGPFSLAVFLPCDSFLLWFPLLFSLSFLGPYIISPLETFVLEWESLEYRERLKRTIKTPCNALTSYKQFMNIKL